MCAACGGDTKLNGLGWVAQRLVPVSEGNQAGVDFKGYRTVCVACRDRKVGVRKGRPMSETKKLMARDRGVCCACGADTIALYDGWKLAFLNHWTAKYPEARRPIERDLLRLMRDSTEVDMPGWPHPPAGFSTKRLVWWRSHHHQTLCLPCYRTAVSLGDTVPPPEPPAERLAAHDGADVA